jgi:predicted MFS family arabinose efflux permease
MATAALFTAMMDACAEGTAATDYTVQASVVVLATGAGGALSGFVARHLGYPAHFALAALVSFVAVGYAAARWPLLDAFRRAASAPSPAGSRTGARVW